MDILDRVHHALLAALERAGPLERPLTVGEIYQHLIPYRTMRGELGVWELAEYEHALLRLLAGEGGRVTVLSPEAVEEFRRELASPNPILGIYRDYSTVEVRPGGPNVDAPVVERSASPEPAAPRPEPASPPPADDALLVELPAPATCHACGTELPAVEGLRFCPACGADQLAAPCRECGSPLKPEWNFCIRCGVPRDPRAAPRGGD